MDRVVSAHDKPTLPQLRAAEILCGILKEFFSISCLRGHRECQRPATNMGRACPGNPGMDVVKLLRARLALSAPER